MESRDDPKENHEIKIARDSKTFLELREIVNKFDPVNLVEHGAPNDEQNKN